MFHQELTFIPQASQPSMITAEKLHKGIYNHHTVAAEIKGQINQTIFLKSLEALANRHTILHARLGGTERHPVLKIITDETLRKKNINNLFKFIDASNLPFTPGYSARILALYNNLKLINKENLIDSPFNLSEGPLWRVGLIAIDRDTYHVVFVFNHIIIDGQSVNIIVKEFSAYYNAFLEGKDDPGLPPIPCITDLDFSLDPQSYQKRINYWEKELEGINPLSSFPTDFVPQQSFKFAGKRLRFHLEKTLIDSIKISQMPVKTTLNQRLFTALVILVYLYTKETTFCIGIPSANRRSEKINREVMDQLVSCFMNSVPTYLQIDQNFSYVELARYIQQKMTEALEHQLPVNIYSKILPIETKSKFNVASLFNILWSLNENKPEFTLNGTTPAHFEDLDLGHTKFSNFAISVDLHDNGGDCFIEYNSDLFKEASMHRLIGHLKNIMTYGAQHPNTKISEIPILLEEEKQLIRDYNNTYHPLPFLNPIHEIFSHLARMNPKLTAIAVHHQDGTKDEITYGELDAESTRLASYLMQLNSAREESIGICVSRSPAFYVAMLAIMKAGKVFVPLPKDKTMIKTMESRAEIAGVKLVITDASTQPLFDDKKLNTFNIIKLSDMTITETMWPAVSKEDPVHIMFTSGSSSETPEPKGVVNMHGGLTNLFGALTLEDKAPEEEIIIGTAPEGFDACLYDFLKLIALLYHRKEATLIILDDECRISPSALNRVIDEQAAKGKKIFMVLTPRHLARVKPNAAVVNIITMGEAPLAETRQKWLAVNQKIKYRNGFGVSEASICLSTYLLKNDANSKRIGKPIINMQMPILDENLRLCPFNIYGQIYVGGPGVSSKGYIGQDKLNKLKFVNLKFDETEGIYNICAENEGERFYKTGDVGRYVLSEETEEGIVIEHEGRMDNQIKIQNVAINTDMISSVLTKAKLIEDIALVPNKNHTALIAFVVPANHAQDFQILKKQILKALKSTQLPRIAYPYTMIEMSALPYSTNGKVNLKVLMQKAEKELGELSNSIDIQNESNNESKLDQPTSKMQTLLQNMWCEILSKPKDKIPINKPFWRLGGDSDTLALFEIMLNACRAKLDLKEGEENYIGRNIINEDMTIKDLELDLKPYLNVKSASSFRLPFHGAFNKDNNPLTLFPSVQTQRKESPTPSHSTHAQTSIRSPKNNN